MSAGIAQLALVAVSGYWFLAYFEITRYKTNRESGYHLFFKSLSWGLVFIIPAWAVARLCFSFPLKAPAVSGDEFFILKFVLELLALRPEEALIIWGVSFILAILVKLAWDFLDQWLPGDEGRLRKRIRKAAWDRGDHLEVLLEDAKIRTDLVELSLSNGKAYIGFIIESGITHHDGENADILLIPAYSGYRDKCTRKLFIDYDYSKVVFPVMRERQGEETREGGGKLDLRVAVPANQVDIARIVPRKDSEYQFKYQRTPGFKVFSETEGGEALHRLSGADGRK